MKTGLLIALALTIGAFCFGQVSHNLLNTNDSLLNITDVYDNVVHYAWDNGKNDWRLSGKNIYLYQDDLLIEVHNYIVNIQNELALDSKIVYTYNSNKLIESEITQVFNGTDFLNGGKKSYEYYEDGKVKTLIQQRWEFAHWINTFKYDYSYEEKNENSIEKTIIDYYWNDKDTLWKLKGKKKDFYQMHNNYNYWDSVNYFSLIDGKWIKSETLQYIIKQFDEFGNVIEFLSISSLNHILDTIGKQCFKYNTENYRTEYQYFDYKNGIWELYDQHYYVYDEENRLIIDSSTSLSTNTPLRKIEYNYIKTSCSENKSNELIKVDIYPFPAKDKLNINIRNAELQQIEIKIYNIIGIKIQYHSTFLNTNNESIILSMNYPAGIYFINIKTNKNYTITKSFIIIK